MTRDFSDCRNRFLSYFLVNFLLVKRCVFQRCRTFVPLRLSLKTKTDISSKKVLFIFSLGINDAPHGLKGRASNAALPDLEIQAIRQFLIRKADTYGRVSPMAISRKEPPPIYFPTGTKYYLMYKDYYQSRKELRFLPVSLSTFKIAWKRDLPQIKIQTRRTDMCNTCDFLVNELAHRERGKNDRKEEMRAKLNGHCDWANSSREFYHVNQACVLAVWRKYGVTECKKFPEEATDSVRMISYDFAQLSMVPHNTDQRGSIYFKVTFFYQN